MDRLPTAGFEQYEISSYARLNRRCRHNETYWANNAYYGFGVGAARFIQGRRELNRRNTEDYIRRVLSGESATFQSEELSAEEAARLTPQAALMLCCLPGVSTAGGVTDISGRGVGMAATRSLSESLGGVVVVRSRAGVGTTFEFRFA